MNTKNSKNKKIVGRPASVKSSDGTLYVCVPNTFTKSGKTLTVKYVKVVDT